jgi:hypothetical protein
VPILCEPFGGDAFAAAINLSTLAGFDTRVRVTCRKGFRAVPKGLDANVTVSCNLPSDYIILCGICGWIRDMECRPIVCELPRGPHVFVGQSLGEPNRSDVGQSLGKRTIGLGVNVTVECNRGYMLTPLDHNFTTHPLYPSGGLPCENYKYEAICSTDCLLEPVSRDWKVSGFGRSCEDIPGFVGNYGAASSCAKLSVHPTPAFYCREAYDRTTNFTAEKACCVCGGGTSLQLLQCSQASCPPFASFGRSRITGQSTSVPVRNSTHIEILCASGFRFDSDTGPARIIAVCGSDCRYRRLTDRQQYNTNNTKALQENGSVALWQDDFMCTAASCVYTLDVNADVFFGSERIMRAHISLQSDDVIEIQCKQGYRVLRGFTISSTACSPDDAARRSYNVRCKEGALNHTERCVPVECPAMQTNDTHMRFSRGALLFDESMNITCEYGYFFDTSTPPAYYTVTCLDTCTYSMQAATIPQCIPSVCTTRPASAHYLPHRDQLFQAQSTTLECDFGHVLIPWQPILYDTSAIAANFTTCASGSLPANCSNMTLAAAFAGATSAAYVAALQTHTAALQTLSSLSCNRSAVVRCDNGILQPSFICMPRAQSGCPTEPCAYPSSPGSNANILGSNVESWDKLPVPAYGEGNYWANGSDFLRNTSLANHMVQLNATCAANYLVIALDSSGNPLANSVTCGAGVGRSYIAHCTHGAFRVAHTCVPMACPIYAQASWPPNVVSAAPMATVIFGEARGINISCAAGYRPNVDHNDVAPTDPRLKTWHLAECRSTCDYAPRPCNVVECRSTIPINSHIVGTQSPTQAFDGMLKTTALPSLPVYQENFTIECNFGYHMTLDGAQTSSDSSKVPYLPGAVRLYQNPRCIDVPGWFDAVTPFLGCIKYVVAPLGYSPGYECGTSMDAQSKNDVNGMNASQACCVCGGGVRPEFCKTRLSVTCADAAIEPAAARCVPTMSCGCGTAACTVSAGTFGPHASNYSVLPVPAYGEDEFWARSAFFEGDVSRISHKVKLQVECEKGFRAVRRDIHTKIAAINVSDCAASRSFQAQCKDCKFLFDEVCRPVVCPKYRGPTVTNIPTYGALDSNDFISGSPAALLRAARMASPTSTPTTTSTSTPSNNTILTSNASNEIYYENTSTLHQAPPTTPEPRTSTTTPELTSSTTTPEPTTSTTTPEPTSSTTTPEPTSSTTTPELTSSTTPPPPARSEGLFSDVIDISCSADARAMSVHGPLPDDACAAPSTLTAVCSDACSWYSDLACQPLFCAPYPSDKVDDTGRRIVGDTITVNCSSGFRAGSNSSNASRSFSVTCQPGCKYSQGVECVGVLCGTLTLQKANTSLYIEYMTTSWQTVYNSSKSYMIPLELGGSNVTVTCAAHNCSCSDTGVSTTISPWSDGCGCACRPPDVSAPLMLARYFNEYPYTLNRAEAVHGQSVVVTCQEGFRGEMGSMDGTCFDSFQVACWDGAYLPETLARCVPSVCPRFNDLLAWQEYNMSSSASNTSSSGYQARSTFVQSSAPRVHDANAASWNLTSEAGYGVSINVTCKTGYRGVPAGFTGEVLCSAHSWYVSTCATCDWVLSISCQPVWCAAPAGVHVKSTMPASFSRFGDPAMHIFCADGRLVAPHGGTADVHPRAVGELCLDSSYSAACLHDCSLLMPHTCQQAKCPPSPSELGIAEGVAHGANVISSCPSGFRFDRTEEDDGQAQVEALCNPNCLYSRVSLPAGKESQGWPKDFECRAPSCGSVDAVGRVVNGADQVLLPPPGGQILWRSDLRLYSPGDVFLNDTFIVGCIQDYQRAGTSLAGACEFQFKAVCAQDGSMRLVDDAAENAYARLREEELQAISDLNWRVARNASMRIPNCSSDPVFLAANLAACNGSVPRPVREPLMFSGGVEPLLLVTKTWQAVVSQKSFYMVTLHRTCTRALTFQNMCPAFERMAA